MKKQENLFNRVSIISIIGFYGFFIWNLLRLVGFMGFSIREALWEDLTWTLFAFGSMLVLAWIFRGRKWAPWLQVATLYFYGILIIFIDGLEYDCLIFFMLTILLLKQYGLLRKHLYKKIYIGAGITAGLIFGSSYLHHYILATRYPFDEIASMVVFCLITGAIIMRILKEDIKHYQDLKKQTRDYSLKKIGRLCAGIVHTIRNAMNAPYNLMPQIKKIFEQVLSGSEKDEWLVNCDDINKGIKVSLYMTDRLSNWINGKKSFQPELGPIEDCLIMAVKLSNNNDEVIKKINIQNELPTVIFDPNIAMEIFMNIIQNAIRSMTTTAKKSLTVSANLENNKIIVRFADTGCGMKQATIKRCFEDFYRKDPTSGGMGIGMGCIKNGVEQHGWELNITSEVGRGTDVAVSIPLGVTALR